MFRFYGTETDQCEYAESRCSGEAEGKVINVANKAYFRPKSTDFVLYGIKLSLSIFSFSLCKKMGPVREIEFLSPGLRKSLRATHSSVIMQKPETIASRRTFAIFYLTTNLKMAKRTFMVLTSFFEEVPKMHILGMVENSKLSKVLRPLFDL